MPLALSIAKWAARERLPEELEPSPRERDKGWHTVPIGPTIYTAICASAVGGGEQRGAVAGVDLAAMEGEVHRALQASERAKRPDLLRGTVAGVHLAAMEVESAGPCKRACFLSGAVASVHLAAMEGEVHGALQWASISVLGQPKH
eukprot:1050771-Pelagomonas_calceolata.AAC.5